jgi:hypothetical protein
MGQFAIGFHNVFARVSVSPNSGGLPGTNQAEKVISGLSFGVCWRAWRA